MAVKTICEAAVMPVYEAWVARCCSLTLTSGQGTWSARRVETCTAGAAGGPGEPTGSNPGRAPRSDPDCGLRGDHAPPGPERLPHAGKAGANEPVQRAELQAALGAEPQARQPPAAEVSPEYEAQARDQGGRRGVGRRPADRLDGHQRPVRGPRPAQRNVRDKPGRDPGDRPARGRRVRRQDRDEAGEGGRPVQVHWSRAEEFQCGFLRPIAVIDVRAGLDAEGSVTAWDFLDINAGAN